MSMANNPKRYIAQSRGGGGGLAVSPDGYQGTRATGANIFSPYAGYHPFPQQFQTAMMQSACSSHLAYPQHHASPPTSLPGPEHGRSAPSNMSTQLRLSTVPVHGGTPVSPLGSWVLGNGVNNNPIHGQTASSPSVIMNFNPSSLYHENGHPNARSPSGLQYVSGELYTSNISSGSAYETARRLTVPDVGAPGQRRGSSSSSVESVESIVSDPVECEICRRAAFSGEYRKGNLARHKRQKHGGEEQVYPCQVDGCRPKAFKRQDARLKHYRKHHPGLVSDPQPRKS